MRPLNFALPFRRAALFCVGAILLGASFAAAEPTYVLKLKMTPGEKWDFDLSSSLSQKGQVSANGQQQPFNRQIGQHRKGTAEVLAAENGIATAMRITFSPDCANTGDLGGQPVPPCTLAGKTVTLRKQNGATTNDLPDQNDQAAVQELNHMLDPDMSIYPKDAVALNQEWDGDTAALAAQFQLAPTDKCSVKCKLMAVKEADGRQVADVAVTGHITKVEQGIIETRITLGGVTRIDLQSGQTITGNMIGKMTIRNVPAPGAPPNLNVQADGDIEVHQTVTLAGAAAPAATGGFNAPAPQPPAPAAPAPAANPLAGGGDAPFAGAYKGDQIQLDLNAENNAYTGALTVAGKKYPVAAAATGGKLVGHFDSEGAKFDFSAALDGLTLTLISEGNTYTLKKAPANPLAKPKNPLAQ